MYHFIDKINYECVIVITIDAINFIILYRDSKSQDLSLFLTQAVSIRVCLIDRIPE